MLKTIHLGWVSDSLKTIMAFVDASIEPIVVNTEPQRFFAHVSGLGMHIPIACNLYEGLDLLYPRFIRFGFVLSAVRRFVSPLLSPRIAKVVERHGPIDFVFAHWGVGVLPEIALLKQDQKTKHLPIILNMETFPTSWRKGWRENLEIMMFKRVAPFLTAVIASSPEMAEVICKIAPALSPKNILVKPFYYPKQFVSARDRYTPRGGAEIVFMGQMDLSRSLNNVTQQLKSLASTGLIVHCAPVNGLSHPNIRFFNPFGGEALSSGEITAYMRQFKACLVTYNVPDPNHSALRFQTSLPSRFLIALASGVPVLMPKDCFCAMERIVVTENVGYAYNSPKDAFQAVTSPQWDKIWENARCGRQSFLFDKGEFRRFVTNLL